MKPFKIMIAPLALMSALAFVPGTAAIAQDDVEAEVSAAPPIQARSEQIVDLLNDELDVPLEEVFTAGFLAAVPPSQLSGLSAQLTTQFGKALAVERLEPASGNRSALAIRMERAIGSGGIAIDESDGNKISELLFRSFEPTDDTAQKIRDNLNALPGEIGVYFGPLDGSDPVISINPDQQFAIGSTFKLYVLAALSKHIESGAEDWKTTIDLSGVPRSFPSGMMQDWPEGAPVTLQTLATMMISISDNTATDRVMLHVGVDAVIKEMIDSGHSDPALNIPFMTTRELFALKSSAADAIEEFRAADPVKKAELLRALSNSDLDRRTVQSAFSGGPIAIDIEWLASANDLRRLLSHIASNAQNVPLDIMAVNTSVTPSGSMNWPRAYYKGGSEPGVLNLTWLLYNQAGEPYVLTLGWNNPEANLDNSALELIAQRIMALSI